MNNITVQYTQLKQMKKIERSAHLTMTTMEPRFAHLLTTTLICTADFELKLIDAKISLATEPGQDPPMPNKSKRFSLTN